MQIKRTVYQTILDHMDKPEITLLIGPRQVGKTTIMKEVIAHCEKNGSMTIFLNLDREEDMRWFHSQQTLLDRIRFLVGKTEKRVYIAIDEIQRKEDAGRFLK